MKKNNNILNENCENLKKMIIITKIKIKILFEEVYYKFEYKNMSNVN
jgi:hypothetical protein